ncbi:MAG TPA: 2OG-Fe(II) oxygenase [Blastocatellia bacterium]|nr:2OG-Fe(II) oxygenase [Blastocatellia bacterium]
MDMNRDEMGRVIAEKIRAHTAGLQQMWHKAQPVKHFFIDDLLPADDALAISRSFPAPDQLSLKSSLRERKRTGVEVHQYTPCIGECLFAFQHTEVIKAIAEVTGLEGLEADPTLYASGVSLMGKGDFLNPHIDNSHDGDRARYRLLNLLFYVSPDWRVENGGNLELWDEKIRRPHPILSRFNRLVVMLTNRTSWHSVNKVLVDAPRLCVSNYYFAMKPASETAYLNVTTFAGRPEETVKRPLLKLDATLLNALGKTFPQLTRMTRHRLRAN